MLRPCLPRDDRGVTPVVGVALILVITTGAIAMVVYWGLPTLQQSRARGGLDSVVEQLVVVDDLTKDLAQTGGSTTASTQLTINQGGLVLEERGTRWIVVYGVDEDRPLNLSVTGLDDADETYTIRNHGSEATPQLHVRHSVLNGSAFEDLEPAGNRTIPAGGAIDVTVREGGLPFALDGVVLRIRVHNVTQDVDDLLAEAWVVDTGALSYRSSSPAGFYAAQLTNGVVRARAPHGDWLRSADAIQSFETAAVDDPLVYVSLRRLVPADDASLTAGRGTWTLRLHAVQSLPLTPESQKAHHLRIRVAGEEMDVWQRHLHLRTLTEDAGGDLVTPWMRLDGGLYRAGPVDMSVFYHETRFAEGLRPG